MLSSLSFIFGSRSVHFKFSLSHEGSASKILNFAWKTFSIDRFRLKASVATSTKILYIKNHQIIAIFSAVKKLNILQYVFLKPSFPVPS